MGTFGQLLFVAIFLIITVTVGAAAFPEGPIAGMTMHHVGAAGGSQPIITFKVFPATVQKGGAVFVSWYAFGTASCKMIGPNVSLNKTAGFEVFSPLQHSAEFTLLCETPSGPKIARRTVSVLGHASPFLRPACSITVSPATIRKGESATLQWAHANTEIFMMNNSVESASSGSKSVQPTETTVYNGHAIGPGGFATCGVVLAVLPE